jgi:4-amino-4-deoxy-L-arabinose transferase-like glycosyltransferase
MPPSTFLPSSREDRRAVVILLLLSAIVFLPGLGGRDLWNPDEPRYAEVAREMTVTGQYLVPHLNGELYYQKPPLFFWAIAFAGQLWGGVTEAAARLPSALAAIGAVALTFLLGRLFFDRRVAWLAAIVLATCNKVLWQGHVGQIDMFLAFWVLLALYCWALGWVRKEPRFYPLFFVFTGVATLAKGPAGFLPPLLSVLIFLALERDREGLRELRVGRGFLIWGAVVFAWLVPAIVIGGQEYYEQIIWRQNVTRYANAWHHHRPWFYFLTVLPGDFFPWSFFLPGALWAGWRRLTGEHRRRFLFALTWVVVTIVFFSFSPGKRTVYILHMYPGLALLVGAGLDALRPLPWGSGAQPLPRLGPERLHRRWLTWPAGFLAVLTAVVAVALPIAGPKIPEAVPLGADLPWRGTVVFAILAVGFAAAWWAAMRGRIFRFAGSVASAMAVAGLLAFNWILPRADVVKSARPLARLLVAVAEPGEPYGIYPRLDPPFLFYTERHAVALDSEEKLWEFVDRPGPIWLLAERDDLAELDRPLPLVEVARDGDVADGYLLLTRRELAAERIPEALDEPLLVTPNGG